MWRFKTKDKIEEVYVSEELKEELSKMMLTVEVEKRPAAPDEFEEGFGTRLTRYFTHLDTIFCGVIDSCSESLNSQNSQG